MYHFEFRSVLHAAMTLFVGVSVFSHAHAQPVDIPSSADPSRIGTEERQYTEPLKNIEQPPAEQKVVAQVPEGMEDVRFVLKDLDIIGMTAYSRAEITPLYSHLIDTEISIADLFKVMTDLQQKYVDDGYTLTKVVIPNQNINSGIAALQVIEGYVGSVEIIGDVKPSPIIDSALAEIRGMRPLNTLRLERILLILNDLPDIDVSAVLGRLQNADAEVGAVRMILQGNPHQEIRGQASIDNYGSVFAGPWQSTVNTRIYDIGMNYTTLNVDLSATIPISEQRYGALQYTIPLFGASGTNLTITGTTAWTEPGASLRRLEVKGRTNSLGIGVSYPVIRQRAKTLIADLRLEYKNSRTNLLGDELYDDRLRVATAGVNYAFSDSWAGYNIADLHYSKGFDILGARKAGSDNLSRADGQADFSKFNFYLGRIQALPSDFELFGLVSGQYADQSLLSGEEFGFGGSQVGRGYDPSEIAGDRGISASIELRRRHNFEFRGLNLAVQPYLFFDIGKVWNIDNHDTTHMSAASSGLGLRINVDNQWDINFGIAYPLTRSASNPPKYTRDTGPRALISLTKTF